MRPGRRRIRATTRSSAWSKPPNEPGEIRVVTSDRGLTDRVRSLGAAVYRAEGFRDLINPRAKKSRDEAK